MSVPWALAALVLAPLAAAALAFVWPRLGRALTLAATACVATGLVFLVRAVLQAGTQTHALGGWSAPLGIALRADGLAIFMLLVTAVIAPAVALYASRYFRPNAGGDAGDRDSAARSSAANKDRFFWPAYLFLWTALNALFLAQDIFNLYVTLELLGLAAVTLVALAGHRAAYNAALRYLLVSLAASLFYLLGVALIYGRYGTVDLRLLAVSSQADPTSAVALALMTGGLLAKAALLPLHFWLPPAHANAPAPVSAVLSALVVKGAFYIVLRLWFEAFANVTTEAAAQLLGGLGGAAIIWGSIHALRQTRLKLLVAYSTVAQLGYLFLMIPLAQGNGVGALAWQGGLLFLAAHACAKTAMFLSAGNILLAGGHDRIAELDGVTHTLPVSVAAFALSGVSLVGLPPSGGFAGKWLLLRASFAQGQWWWSAVMLLGSLLAAAYVLRVLTRAFVRTEQPFGDRRLPRTLEWVAFGLALAALGLGFTATWLVDLIGATGPLLGTLATGGGAP